MIPENDYITFSNSSETFDLAVFCYIGPAAPVALILAISLLEFVQLGVGPAKRTRVMRA